ncbi:ATP-grasp domain-containing protein, partial [archaeon]
MKMLLFLPLLLPLVASLDVTNSVSVSNEPVLPTRSPRRLLLVDGFTEYIGGICRQHALANDIKVIDMVSPYIAMMLKSQGQVLPPHLIAPTEETLQDWLEVHQLDLPLERDSICFLAESDCGVVTAEKCAHLLGIETGNSPIEEIQSKFVANEKLRVAGLPPLRQGLLGSWEEARLFLNDLWLHDEDEYCVIQPTRGVASDGAFLCRGLKEAEEKFRFLLSSPQYGGGLNQQVLVQQFIRGQEYAVDTVTRGGETKVLAIWRCHKVTPFVYKGSLLLDPREDPELYTQICDFVKAALHVNGVHNLPTHTTVKYVDSGSDKGLYLMEINPRFHAQHIVQILRDCLGYDPMTAAIDACFHADRYSRIPSIPTGLYKQGRIAHLAVPRGGRVRGVRHLDYLQSLPSVQHVLLAYAEGQEVRETVDIQSDGGYVTMVHADTEVVQRDYEKVLQLQREVYDIQEEGGEGSETIAVQGMQAVEQQQGEEGRQERRRGGLESSPFDRDNMVQMIRNEEAGWATGNEPFQSTTIALTRAGLKLPKVAYRVLRGLRQGAMWGAG